MLGTERLVLRAFAVDDWQDVHELAIDWGKAPGPDFDKWPTTEEAARGLTEHFSSSPKYFAMCVKEARKVVGLVALNGDDIDCEAIRAIVDHIFQTENPAAIVTHNDPTHREQLAPLIALGFSAAGEAEEGTLVLARAEWERWKAQ